jgi:HTH-type transcriptional regulator/antitoxin HigA
MKPKLIKTESEYEAALARIEKLMSARPNTPQGDELELLSLLVHDYEDRVFPMDRPDPIAAIRFRMEQQGLKPGDLTPFLGSRSRVSEVLSGRRNLSLKMDYWFGDGAAGGGSPSMR